MTDAWDEATYVGKARAQRRRFASLTPEQRLAWLEDALIEAERTGVLARVRQRKQRDVVQAWERSATGQ
jgi:hypothetical protein